MLPRENRSLEQHIRKSLESFTSRVRAAVDTELDSLAAELLEAVDSAQQQALAEAESGAAAREAAARADATRELAQQIEDARVEAESRLSEQIATARTAAFAEARDAARAEAEEKSAREMAVAASDAAAARAIERDAKLAAVERLAAAVRRIDAAGTLRDTLEALVESAALETPRVAVLLIEGSSVRPFSQRGFDEVPASGPIAPGGVVEACVRHGQPAFTGDAAGLKAPGFAALQDDRAGFAAPLRVGARTVAVLYADDAGDAEPDAPATWPEALEVLARHSSLHLENLTAVRAVAHIGTAGDLGSTGTTAAAATDEESARRYARLLVSEIKLYNEPAVRLGRENRDLRTRLSAEIDRARRTYLERVPPSVAARDAYFETELVQTLAGGDSSTL